MAMLRCNAALVAAVCLAACTPGLNWRQVSLDSSSATALLPCEPDRASRMVPLGGVPTPLDVAGCDAARATFALMTATIDAGRDADAILAGWQRATLENMRAGDSPASRVDYVPRGGVALAHAQRINASGKRADGSQVVAHALWAARAAPEGATELLHAVIYARRADPTVADTFFSGIRWP